MDQADPDLIEEIRAWAVQQNYQRLLGGEVVAAQDMTDAEMLDLMDRVYPGGSDAWGSACDEPDDHISMAPHGQWT